MYGKEGTTAKPTATADSLQLYATSESFSHRKAGTFSSRTAPRESYSVIQKLQLRTSAGQEAGSTLPGASILSLSSVLRCGTDICLELLAFFARLSAAKAVHTRCQKGDTFIQKYPLPINRGIISTSTSTRSSWQASCLNPSRN